MIINLARACAAKLVCLSIGLLLYCTPAVAPCVYPHVFSQTVAAVDTKRGYMGTCNGRSAQQGSGVALSKNSMITAGAKNYIPLLY